MRVLLHSPCVSNRSRTGFFSTVLGSGSYPDRGSVGTDSRQNALPTYLSPGRAAKRKKTKIGGTYLLQGPLGRSKPDLPTYCIGCHRGKQTPYLAGGVKFSKRCSTSSRHRQKSLSSPAASGPAGGEENFAI